MSKVPKTRLNRPRGFTLLEVLIATAVTMLLMLGLAQVFKILGDSITKGRAGLELNNRLRNVMHRIRTDLDNVTVTPTPPVKVGAGQGYLKVYDGPMHDALFAANPLLNRFGDVDDIFMATVKAQDAWFTGKVPRFVLEGRTGAAADANGNGIADDLADLVTISSQYAEVVIYAEPLASNDSNPTRNPLGLAVNPTNAAGLPMGFEDTFSGTASATDGIPDGFRLHYRVLLIRPDLNLSSGELPNFLSVTPANPTTRAMVAGAESLAPLSATTLPTPTCDMYRIHQYCDLSVRRVIDSDLTMPDSVAANNLEDLANPANRFAHVQYPIPGSTTLVSMPVLALGPIVPMLQGTSPATTLAGTGFLHPAFTLLGSRTGEDIMGIDLLAFDIRLFDPSARVLGYVGPDGQPGDAVDTLGNPRDDDSNGVDNRTPGSAIDIGELGWPGTDDLVLRPGDPGFAARLGEMSIPVPQAQVVAFGEFVDLNWSGKAGLVPPVSVDVASVFSDVPNPKSGLTRRLVSGAVQIFQPSYDTFTDFFERDGVYQAQIGGTGVVVSRSGPVAVLETLVTPNWTRTLVDSGNDDIDNDGDTIADDVDEKETLPPYVSELRGLQISVRMEDKATKQFKQMSTVKEFVTR